MNYKIILVFTSIIIGVIACKQTEYIGPISPCDLSNIPYNPSSYTVVSPNGFPAMEHPEDNPITVQGIELGRHLFYDPILSRDSTISCSSCHDINKAFTDGLAKSKGIDNRIMSRSSMSLINIGYSWIKGRAYNFMWDGRFATLEEQIIKGPIENPLEMDNTWEKVETDLRQHPTYPRMFREAFGIDCYDGISKELVAKAIAQFERTLNSAGSRYDEDVWVPLVYLSNQELRGMTLFIGDAAGSPSTKDAECAHCHSFSKNKALFARNEFSNNGLDSAQTLFDFADNGYGDATGNAPENGQFREVSLRNVGLTAPYMHDGRFQTLEEVVDHYATGGHYSPNLASELTTAPTITSLDANDKADIVAFLHALTDSTYFNKPEWSSPF
ncbi:MAG: Cytochrome-c peroxidase [uncultured Aureispira sp.]|uniref:Cytochrome-c peroxidase n=1 Tax=uncultured Aureispira sp. TaxID=1331704 RepID=A0A6S6S3P9_9BACT|nr:MAG: Cytochrome-c peroxidase [uncultured Aureispira sp.]